MIRETNQRSRLAFSREEKMIWKIAELELSCWADSRTSIDANDVTTRMVGEVQNARGEYG